MKRSRFSEEQTIGILREAEAGSPIKAVVPRTISVRRPTTWWKRRFGGMKVSEAKRLRALEEENSRLKRLVADPAVQIHILKEVNGVEDRPATVPEVLTGTERSEIACPKDSPAGVALRTSKCASFRSSTSRMLSSASCDLGIWQEGM